MVVLLKRVLQARGDRGRRASEGLDVVARDLPPMVRSELVADREDVDLELGVYLQRAGEEPIVLL